MGHQRGRADLRNAPWAPLLPPISSGTDSELIINIGVDVQHHELCLQANIHIFEVTGSTLPILQSVILRYEVLIHLQKHLLH